jgi:hypothetical protein
MVEALTLVALAVGCSVAGCACALCLLYAARTVERAVAAREANALVAPMLAAALADDA